MPAVLNPRPIFKPDIDFNVKHDILEERATIVHCTMHIITAIRIWPTTFLIQMDGSRKNLLQAYNITAYPEWKLVFIGHTFTLVFEGLDKHCLLFDLLEDIPEEGRFSVKSIKRNKTDVYNVPIE